MMRIAKSGISSFKKFSERKEPTYLTPGWCQIDSIVMPNDRIDELVDAGKSGPHHVKTCTRIPGFDMPWEWNNG